MGGGGVLSSRGGAEASETGDVSQSPLVGGEASVFKSGGVFKVMLGVFLSALEGLVVFPGTLFLGVVEEELVSLGSEEGILFQHVGVGEAHVGPTVADAPLGVPVIVVLELARAALKVADASCQEVELAGEVVIELFEALGKGLKDVVLRGHSVRLWGEWDVS